MSHSISNLAKVTKLLGVGGNPAGIRSDLRIKTWTQDGTRTLEFSGCERVKVRMRERDQGEGERDRDTERDREREREGKKGRERERERSVYKCAGIYMANLGGSQWSVIKVFMTCFFQKWILSGPCLCLQSPGLCLAAGCGLKQNHSFHSGVCGSSPATSMHWCYLMSAGASWTPSSHHSKYHGFSLIQSLYSHIKA